MFARVLKAQQSKVFRSSVLWVEVGLLAAFALLITVLRNVTTELGGDSTETVGGQLLDVLQTTGTATMGGMLAVVLAGALMAQEYGWRSLHLWLSKGVARSTFLWTKFLSMLGPILLFFVAAALVTLPASALLVDGEIALDWGEIFLTMAAGVYAVLPYTALALLLAVVGRSMLVAIGGGLVITLLVENLFVQLANLLGDGATQILPYLPNMLAQGVMRMESEMTVAPLDPAPAAALIAVYTVILLGAATIVLRRQDLSD